MEETIITTRTYQSGTFSGTIVRQNGAVKSASIRNGAYYFESLYVTSEWMDRPYYKYLESLADLLELVKEMIVEAAAANEMEFERGG